MAVIPDVIRVRYCYEKGFDWNGLYKYFKRVSCWCCPLQPLSELRILYNYYPELWKQLREWDDKTWRKFRADYSVRELEIRFEFEKECIARNEKINNKVFFDKLYKRLKAKAPTEVAGAFISVIPHQK